MTVTVEQAQNALTELIDRTARGEKIVITRDDKAVAELVPVPGDKPQPRFGSCKGMLEIVSEDDDHLKDFADYMPRGCCSTRTRGCGSSSATALSAQRPS